jgi:hypothetical protein
VSVVQIRPRAPKPPQERKPDDARTTHRASLLDNTGVRLESRAAATSEDPMTAFPGTLDAR